MTLDGLEVLETRPDFAEDPEIVGARIFNDVRVGPARAQRFFPGKKVVHAMEHRYVLRGAAVAAFEAFFNARAGMWEPFLVPSWHSELGVNGTNGNNSPSGAPDLYVDWCDYAVNYPPVDGSLGRHVFVLWSDGTFFASRVNAVGATSAGVYDRLTLNSNLPKTVDVADPPVVGFLYHATFDRDELDLKYSGIGEASFSMGFAEWVVSTPEADA